MSDGTRERTTIDYATPRDEDPRPSVALWVAAGLIWFVSGGTFAGILALLVFVGPAAFLLLVPGLLFAGVFALEWHAVVRRSLACATFVFAISAAYAGVAGILFLMTAAMGYRFDTSRPHWEEAASFALMASVTGFVAFTHERWSSRLNERGEKTP